MPGTTFRVRAVLDAAVATGSVAVDRERRHRDADRPVGGEAGSDVVQDRRARLSRSMLTSSGVGMACDQFVFGSELLIAALGE